MSAFGNRNFPLTFSIAQLSAVIFRANSIQNTCGRRRTNQSLAGIGVDIDWTNVPIRVSFGPKLADSKHSTIRKHKHSTCHWSNFLSLAE